MISITLIGNSIESIEIYHESGYGLEHNCVMIGTIDKSNFTLQERLLHAFLFANAVGASTDLHISARVEDVVYYLADEIYMPEENRTKVKHDDLKFATFIERSYCYNKKEKKVWIGRIKFRYVTPDEQTADFISQQFTKIKTSEGERRNASMQREQT